MSKRAISVNDGIFDEAWASAFQTMNSSELEKNVVRFYDGLSRYQLEHMQQNDMMYCCSMFQTLLDKGHTPAAEEFGIFFTFIERSKYCEIGDSQRNNVGRIIQICKERYPEYIRDLNDTFYDVEARRKNNSDKFRAASLVASSDVVVSDEGLQLSSEDKERIAGIAAANLVKRAQQEEKKKLDEEEENKMRRDTTRSSLEEKYYDPFGVEMIGYYKSKEALCEEDVKRFYNSLDEFDVKKSQISGTRFGGVFNIYTTLFDKGHKPTPEQFDSFLEFCQKVNAGSTKEETAKNEKNSKRDIDRIVERYYELNQVHCQKLYHGKTQFQRSSDEERLEKFLRKHETLIVSHPEPDIHAEEAGQLAQFQIDNGTPGKNKMTNKHGCCEIM